MAKTFVLDTNVLLHDPTALEQFPGGNIVLPLFILEELDSMKKAPTDLGQNARSVIRMLDDLSRAGKGNLREGITLDHGGTVKIFLETKSDKGTIFSIPKKQNQIIMAADLLRERGEHVIFVSKDFAARVKAEALGLEAEDYENLKASYDTIYRGLREVEVSKEELEAFFHDGFLPFADKELHANEFCSLCTPEKKSNVVGRYDSKAEKLVPIVTPEKDIWGIKPLNTEQQCALDLLLRDDVNLVTLVGPAGTGKTLLAIATALHKIFDKNTYKRMLITRPIVPLGKDIGYLPGTKEEKLYHWMQPIYDNLKVLCDSLEAEPNETMRWLLESKKIEMEAVTYIRGRSLPKMFMIVDEAQNLTPHDMKTIISRAGKGTKLVFTGDPSQIDNPYLDKDSNGLTVAVEAFKEYPIAGSIFLETTERSEIAALAANIM